MNCSNCNKKLGFFSKIKHQQKIYCPECYHSLFRRFQYEAIPAQFLGETTLKRINVYENHDRVITAQYRWTEKTFAIHVLLYTKSSNILHSGNRDTRYIGIELCTGRVFAIEEDRYHNRGPDDHESDKIRIYEIQQNLWNNFMTSRSNLIQDRLKDFSIENAKQYLNFTPYNLNYYKRFDLIYQNYDEVTIICAYAEYDVVDIAAFTKKMKFPFVCLKYTLPATYYYELKSKNPHIIDHLSSEFGGYLPGSTYINKKLSRHERENFSNKMEDFCNEFKNICNFENDGGSPNVMYFENGGTHIQQTYIDNETMGKLVNRLENVAQFEKCTYEDFLKSEKLRTLL